MIPQEKHEAVARALQETFGVTTFEDISRITRGHTSSLVFRIIVRGSPYLLKIVTRTEDSARHYACMKASAEAGLAPRVLYTNTGEKISITDFVQAESFSQSEARLQLPAVLRRLHALTPFARAPFNTTCTFLLQKSQMVDGFLQKFRANPLPKCESDELFSRYAELAAVYPYDDREMVSSHNDLFKPDNILFDGQRVWLVDWEAAFLNDRYADLAVVAHQVVTNHTEEIAYLRGYFGSGPTPYQLARFYLMQQLAHLFYTMAFLFLAASGQPVDCSRPVPEFTEYQRRIWAGEVDLSDKEVKIAYGRVHWARFLDNVHSPRYNESLQIISGSRAAP